MLPRDIGAVRTAESFIDQENYDDAIKLLKTLPKTHLPVTLLLAKAYLEQDNFKKVIDLLEPLAKKLNRNEALLLATAYSKKNEFNKVIQLLEPFNDSQAKEHHLRFVTLLANAYEHTSDTKKAFPLLKIIYQNNIKKVKEDKDYSRLSPALAALANMILFADNFAVIILVVANEALNIANDCVTLPEEKTSLTVKDINDIKDDCHAICFNAGYRYNEEFKKHISAKYSENSMPPENADKVTPALTDEQFFQKEKDLFKKLNDSFEQSKKYYELALAYKPRDLETLLNLALITHYQEDDADSPLAILLPHSDFYKDNLNYISAIGYFYALKNDVEAINYHQKKYPFEEKNLERRWRNIFLNYSALSQSHPIINQASEAYDQKNYTKAKETLTPFFALNPYHYKALILLANIERMLGNHAEAIRICDIILAINAKCTVALIMKIDCLWLSTEPENKEKAVSLCEQSFKNGLKDGMLLDILIEYYLYQAFDNTKLLFYALENVKLKKSTINYYHLGVAYQKSNNIAEALNAFQQAKALDQNNFQNGLVALNVIYCLLLLAQTKKDFKYCAKKLRSFISYQGPIAHASYVEILTTYFKELNIDIVAPLAEKQSSCGEKKEEDEQDADWVVPPEIKEKILALMSKISYEPGKEEKSNSDDEAEEEPENLVSLGPHLKGYISSKAKLAPEDKTKFQTALEKGRLLPEKSKGHSDPKIAGDTYKIKISGSGARLFARKIKQVDDDIIIEFGKLKPKHK